MDTQYSQSPLKMLIIDDDPTFGVLLSAVARRKGFEPHFYPSLLNMGSFARIKDFDVAIIDYYLDSVRGDEIAEYAEMFLMNVPVVMISSRDFQDDEKSKWPPCVKKFVPKELGGEQIVDAAASVLERQELIRRLGGDA